MLLGLWHFECDLLLCGVVRVLLKALPWSFMSKVDMFGILLYFKDDNSLASGSKHLSVERWLVEIEYLTHLALMVGLIFLSIGISGPSVASGWVLTQSESNPVSCFDFKLIWDDVAKSIEVSEFDIMLEVVFDHQLDGVEVSSG